VRVRGVQVHGRSTEAAIAGQRTALNLSGASTEDLARGMALAPVETLASTRRFDAQVRLLDSAERPLKTRSRAHFHSNTMETVASLRFHGAAEVAPGETRFARLTLAAPALLLPGDRFILRQFSPVVTIGGGVVVDAAPMKRAAGVEEFLGLLAAGTREEILEARIRRQGSSGISLKALVAETGMTAKAIEGVVAQLVKSGKIWRAGSVLVDIRALAALEEKLVRAVAEFHKKNPLVAGVGREQLREELRVRAEMFGPVVERLVAGKKIEVAGDVVRLPGHGVVMKDEEAESKKKIEEAFSAAGLKVPALAEVLAGLKVDKARAQKIVTLLLREKMLVKISDELVFHRSALDELRRQLAEQKTKSPTIDVARFKEMTGVSRKYAIPLLEYLDRERLTKRVGDARMIL